MYIKNKENGVILISVLLIVLVLSAIAMSIGSNFLLAFKRSIYQDEDFIRRQYFADNPYSYDEYFETTLLDEITDIEFSYMTNRKWYAVWPIDITTKAKIPELVKITFIKNDLEYEWVINPNIDYVYKR